MEATMKGEVRAAIEKTLGRKAYSDRLMYNDWHGRKTLPNRRVFKCHRCVAKRVTKKEIDSFRRSLQQRLAKFGLKVLEVHVRNPYKLNYSCIQERFRHVRHLGGIYIETIEINS